MTFAPALPHIVVDCDPDARNYSQRALFLGHCIAERLRTRHDPFTLKFSVPVTSPVSVERWAGEAPPSPSPATPSTPAVSPAPSMTPAVVKRAAQSTHGWVDLARRAAAGVVNHTIGRNS